MRRFAFAALVALPLAAAVSTPAAAQSGAPFTGVHVDGLFGWDNIQNNGHDNGIAYGINAGYDAAVGNGIRIGIEGELSDSNDKSCSGSRTVADPRFCSKAGRDLYAGARIGKVVGGGRALLYAKIGYTNERLRATENDGIDKFDLGHDNLDGVRLGVGAEYALTGNSFLKAEYRYSNYEQGFSRNQILGGFGFRF